jgi:hypothetical protein
MLSVELTHLANLLDTTRQAKNISSSAKVWSKRIHDAIWSTTVSSCHLSGCRKLIATEFLKLVNNIFAYESDGILSVSLLYIAADSPGSQDMGAST